MASGRAIRTAAWAVVGLGVLAPVLRRRLHLRAPTVICAAAAAPVALAFAAPRSRTRDAALAALQMWAYFAAYEMPADDPDRLRSRVHIDYPLRADLVVGLGRLPTMRLQQILHDEGRFAPWERVLVWSHWVWFAVPHTALGFVLLRHRSRFPASAARLYATFDLGAIVYWTLPTAPPWFAAEAGRVPDPSGRPLQRLMREYGQEVWGDRWPRLYDTLAANPLAAMPSLHFGTSLVAARVLAETGRTAGTIGWAYAGTLGFALVYLGEHYVTDLVAGAALAEGVHRAAPMVAGPIGRLAGLVGRLGALARG